MKETLSHVLTHDEWIRERDREWHVGFVSGCVATGLIAFFVFTIGLFAF